MEEDNGRNAISTDFNCFKILESTFYYTISFKLKSQCLGKNIPEIVCEKIHWKEEKNQLNSKHPIIYTISTI